jgi:hypothetical protein
MYRKILLAGATAAVIVGAGGTALAVSGSGTTSGSPSTSTAQHGKHAGKNGTRGRHGFGQLRRLAHGQFVVKGKGGTFVTHDVINGMVTAVSPTSITVQAADKKSETFAVGDTTKVFQRTVAKKSSTTTQRTKPGKPSKSSIDKVAKGDHAFVTGTGDSTLTAKRVLDLKS